MRRAMLILIQLIEIPLVAGVALLAIFAERLDPALLSPALGALLLPLLLRLLIAGRIAEPTLALGPLLLLALLGGVTIYVTPTWEYTWPELVRFFAGLALCLAVINWMNPIGGSTRDSNNRTINNRQNQPGNVQRATRWPATIPWHFSLATILFISVALLFTAVGMLVLAPTHKFLPANLFGDEFLNRLTMMPLAERFNLSPARLQGLAANGSFNPNRVAGIALLATPLCFALSVGTLGIGRHKARSAAGWVGTTMVKLTSFSAFLLLGSALLLTQSRGALLALVCALVGMLLLLGRRGWVILAALLFLGAVAVTQLQPGMLERFIVSDATTGSTQLSLWQDRNLQGRWLLWQRALHGMADAPLTGMGLGAFAAVSQEPYPALPNFEPDPDMSHVHNIFLQMGIDLGLPGLLLFLGLLGLIALRLAQMIRGAVPHSALQTWSIGLGGSFVAYIVYNSLDAITLGARPAAVVWLLFGIWIGAGEWVQQQLAATQAAQAAEAAQAIEAAQARRNARQQAVRSSAAAPNVGQTEPNLTLQKGSAVATGDTHVGTEISAEIPPMTKREQWDRKAWAMTAGQDDTVG